MNLLILLLGLLFAFLFYHFYYKRRNFPRGPTPIPLIGNLLGLAKVVRFEYKFLEWKNKYGKIYTYWIGESPVVAVNDVKLATEMFGKDGDNYANRGDCGFQKFFGGGNIQGVVFTEGLLWQNQRRFTIRVLRDFGLGKNKMQERILEEIQTIVEKINKDIDSGIEEHSFNRHTDIAVGSLINSLIFGYRFSQNNNEEEFYRLKELSIRMLRSIGNPLVLLTRFNPFLFKLTGSLMEKYYKPFQEIFEFMENQIKRRVKTEEIDETIEPRDLVDAFLIEKAKLKRLGSPEAEYYTLRQLSGLSFDIWFAGQETTSTTLNWAFAYLITHSHVQQKVHDEIDRVIDGDRLITIADKSQLPYMNAVIMEVQRSANIVSQNLLRKTSHHIDIDGYHIPKDTYCIAQISAIHYDPEVFHDPNKFSPERFLDNNNQLIRCDGLMPFSLGKRICLGEGIARAELFLICANLLNQFEFLPGKVAPELDKYPTGGSTSNKPYKCKLKRRF